jgi:hypothetical protein
MENRMPVNENSVSKTFGSAREPGGLPNGIFARRVIRSVLAAGVLFLLILLPGQLFAQDDGQRDPMPIRLKGQILNLEDDLPIPNAFVLNFRTHSGVTADDLGKFVLDMLNIDSLSVSSLGFTKLVVHIPVNYSEMNVLTIYLKPVRFAIPEVGVQGQQRKPNLEGVQQGKKTNIDPELRGDAYNKRPPVLAAVFNPISYIQYYASRRERQKREARKAMVTEAHWSELSKIYTKKLVMELTGLNDTDADNLMIYINSKGLLNQMSNDYDVRETIKQQYKLFKAEGH